MACVLVTVYNEWTYSKDIIIRDMLLNSIAALRTLLTNSPNFFNCNASFSLIYCTCVHSLDFLLKITKSAVCVLQSISVILRYCVTDCVYWITGDVIMSTKMYLCMCLCSLWACAAWAYGMGMCCEKMMMIGWRNAWSMKLRVQGQEEDQRGPGKRLSERTVKLVNWVKKEDAMDRCKWRKMIKDVQWSGWVWVNVSYGTGLPG